MNHPEGALTKDEFLRLLSQETFDLYIGLIYKNTVAKLTFGPHIAICANTIKPVVVNKPFELTDSPILVINEGDYPTIRGPGKSDEFFFTNYWFAYAQGLKREVK